VIKDSTGSVRIAFAILAILPFAAMILTWQVGGCNPRGLVVR
jgi:hypothetical protein